MSTPVSNIHDTPFGAPSRPLTEEVMQSAEEAVLASPASVDILQGGEHVAEADKGVTRVSYTDRLARRASEKPFQSALLALAAGALLAALIKAALSRPRR